MDSFKGRAGAAARAIVRLAHQRGWEISKTPDDQSRQGQVVTLRWEAVSAGETMDVKLDVHADLPTVHVGLTLGLKEASAWTEVFSSDLSDEVVDDLSEAFDRIGKHLADEVGTTPVRHRKLVPEE